MQRRPSVSREAFYKEPFSLKDTSLAVSVSLSADSEREAMPPGLRKRMLIVLFVEQLKVALKAR